MSDVVDPQPAIRRDGIVLGFDVGARRIGVAINSRSSKEEDYLGG